MARVLPRLGEINRVVLGLWWLLVAGMGIVRPGPLDRLSVPLVVGGVIGFAAVGLVGHLRWQRKLWTTSGDGAGFQPVTQFRPVFGLPTLQGSARGRSVVVRSVPAGPLALPDTHVRASLPISADISVVFRVTDESNPVDPVVVRNPDTGHAVVMEHVEGDVDRLLTPEYRSNLMNLDVRGRLRVSDDTVRYELPFPLFGAGLLTEVATETARLAEAVEAREGPPGNH
jgi:hypothetical protein